MSTSSPAPGPSSTPQEPQSPTIPADQEPEPEPPTDESAPLLHSTTPTPIAQSSNAIYILTASALATAIASLLFLLAAYLALRFAHATLYLPWAVESAVPAVVLFVRTLQTPCLTHYAQSHTHMIGNPLHHPLILPSPSPTLKPPCSSPNPQYSGRYHYSCLYDGLRR